jgi:hypothetical protein
MDHNLSGWWPSRAPENAGCFSSSLPTHAETFCLEIFSIPLIISRSIVAAFLKNKQKALAPSFSPSYIEQTWWYLKVRLTQRAGVSVAFWFYFEIN